jgi:hypothetical protein
MMATISILNPRLFPERANRTAAREEEARIGISGLEVVVGQASRL